MGESVLRLAAGLGAAALLLLAVHGGPAGACAIDGLPSLTIDRSLVRINTAQPTSPAALRVWAPFVPPFSLVAVRTYTLAEIRQRIPLTPEAFENPWRWDFGDGSKAAQGGSVQHAYRHPGIYKITVSAYFPSHKIWYAFDALQVRVVAG